MLPARLHVRTLPLALLATLVVAPASGHAAPVRTLMQTQDAEGIAVNRVAVQTTQRRDGRVRVRAVVVARSLTTDTRTLSLRLRTCPDVIARCRTRRAATAEVADAESRLELSATLDPGRRVIGVELARPGRTFGRRGYRSSSLLMLLPPTAWTSGDVQWYGLKTPTATWGTRRYRAVRVSVTGDGSGPVRIASSVRLDLPAPAATEPAPVSGVLGGLLGGLWSTLGRVLAPVLDPRGQTVITGDTRSAIPVDQVGVGLQLSRGDEPLLATWLPRPVPAPGR